MPKKLEPRFWQFVLGTLTVVAGQSGYLYIQKQVDPKLELLTKYDEWLPFWPWTIWIYISIPVIFILASLLLDGNKFRKTWVRVIIGHVFTYPCFILLPAAYPRPSLDGLGQLHHAMFTWLHNFDMAHNTLPSMHVSMTWIIMHELGKTPIRSVPAFTYAIIVSLSVLFTKQHFIIDVVFGFAVYGLSLPMADWILKHYDHWRHPEKLLTDG